MYAAAAATEHSYKQLTNKLSNSSLNAESIPLLPKCILTNESCSFEARSLCYLYCSLHQLHLRLQSLWLQVSCAASKTPLPVFCTSAQRALVMPVHHWQCISLTLSRLHCHTIYTHNILRLRSNHKHKLSRLFTALLQGAVTV